MVAFLASTRSNWWRSVGVVAVLICVLAPVLPLMTTLLDRGGGPWLGSGFGSSLTRGLAVSIGVGALALAVGWPCGVLAGIFRFGLRRYFLAALLLPLLVPPFLWALGWSMVSTTFGGDIRSLLEGFTGTVLAFQGMALPLVFFASLAATRGISGGQSRSSRLAGGERRLILMAARQALGPALLAALLAGGMSLADPGPGQVLGFEGAASQVLISFSAQYDFPLAVRQCLAVAACALVAVLPAAIGLAPGLARGLLARDVKPEALLSRPAKGRTIAAILGLVVSVLVVLPAIGLLHPVMGGFRFDYVARALSRTGGDTLFYGGTAALLAVGFGMFAALCAGRNRKRIAILLSGMMVILVLPSGLGALGLVHAGSGAPAVLDPLFRSRLTVGIWLGLRLFPVATLFLIRRIGESSPSWAAAAAVHGMPGRTFFIRILLPWLTPAALLGALAVALFAVADIHTVLLLHPPGRMSLPLAIFTVMANAPESLVASLCLAYLAGAASLLAAAVLVSRHRLANL